MLAGEKWALISVYNKAGIVDFAGAITSMGWKIIASGGTAKALMAVGIQVRDVADLVGGGAILKHRVVTLSRELHAGLLADVNDPEQVAEMQNLHLPIIQMVVCDFYPLLDAITAPDATIDSVVELTDIGGPTMVRSAAKGNRIVVCRFEDRQIVLDELIRNGYVSEDTRQNLRARAEFVVAEYCLDSARFHSDGQFDGLIGERTMVLPKGENGHQRPSAFYTVRSDDPFGLGEFRIIEGTRLSYNNYADVDRLLQTLAHIVEGWRRNFRTEPAVAVAVKHGNACGAAVDYWDNFHIVVKKTVTGDTRAVFGGLVACNLPIPEGIAEVMITAGMMGANQKFDGVIAPEFTNAAIKLLSRRGGRCRIIQSPPFFKAITLDTGRKMRQVRGGFLYQPNYLFVPDFNDAGNEGGMHLIGKRNEEIEKDLLLAWAVGSTSNSNTITIVKNGMLIGNGVGQQDRVGAAELAIKRARDAGHADKLVGAVAYSDSFFPFPDAPEVLINAGIRAIFSTTGSVNDEVVRKLCASKNVTLYQLPDDAARGFFGH